MNEKIYWIYLPNETIKTNIKLKEGKDLIVPLSYLSCLLFVILLFHSHSHSLFCMDLWHTQIFHTVFSNRISRMCVSWISCGKWWTEHKLYLVNRERARARARVRECVCASLKNKSIAQMYDNIYKYMSKSVQRNWPTAINVVAISLLNGWLAQMHFTEKNSQAIAVHKHGEMWFLLQYVVGIIIIIFERSILRDR